MTAAIEIKELNKSYGRRLAVDGLNLTVEAGEVFGFVGPNGAGKTSTIRIVAGLLRPTSGEVSVAGYSVRQSLDEVKRRIGYMPDFFGVYPDLSVQEYLDFFSACYQIPEGRRSKLIDELLELMELSHRRADRVRPALAWPETTSEPGAYIDTRSASAAIGRAGRRIGPACPDRDSRATGRAGSHG